MPRAEIWNKVRGETEFSAQREAFLTVIRQAVATLLGLSDPTEVSISAVHFTSSTMMRSRYDVEIVATVPVNNLQCSGDEAAAAIATAVRTFLLAHCEKPVTLRVTVEATEVGSCASI